VSFKSKQKKGAIAAAKAKYQPATAARWFLTPVVVGCACARCGGVLRKGRDMVYRHAPRTSLCVLCAQDDPTIRYRPSLRWSAKRNRERPGTTTKDAAEAAPSSGGVSLAARWGGGAT
jgi:hypothetical protein